MVHFLPFLTLGYHWHHKNHENYEMLIDGGEKWGYKIVTWSGKWHQKTKIQGNMFTAIGHIDTPAISTADDCKQLCEVETLCGAFNVHFGSNHIDVARCTFFRFHPEKKTFDAADVYLRSDVYEELSPNANGIVGYIYSQRNFVNLWAHRNSLRMHAELVGAHVGCLESDTSLTVKTYQSVGESQKVCERRCLDSAGEFNV